MSQVFGRLTEMATDEEVLAQLAPWSNSRWNELWDSVEVWRHNPTPFTWKNIEPGSKNMPWVDFDETFEKTFGLMVSVGLLLPSLDWRPLSLPGTWAAQVQDIEQYCLASCARYVTYIARKDRIFEGLLANCVEDDLWAMTLDRARSFVSPDWKRSEF